MSIPVPVSEEFTFTEALAVVESYVPSSTEPLHVSDVFTVRKYRDGVWMNPPSPPFDARPSTSETYPRDVPRPYIAED